MNSYRIFVGKPEGKISLGKLRYGSMNNIKMDIIEMVRAGMVWIALAQDRDQRRALVNTVMNFRVT
jgi:hypothetical protein